MRRAIVTSGRYGNPFSKFRPPAKTISISHYIDTGGKLSIFTRRAVLQERDLQTGDFTGKTYEINLKSVKSKLSGRYKNAQQLEIVCTLGVRQKTVIQKLKGEKKTGKEFSYWMSHIHHILSDRDILSENTESYEETSNIFNSNNTQTTTVNAGIDESNNLDEITSCSIFRYVGKKEEAERKVADKIQSAIGGTRELTTQDGERVDLLVDNLLIEVKAASNWDDAIGQILKYKIHFPKHKSVVFLFDDGRGIAKAKARIEEIISKFLSTTIYVAICVDDLKALLH